MPFYCFTVSTESSARFFENKQRMEYVFKRKFDYCKLNKLQVPASLDILPRFAEVSRIKELDAELKDYDDVYAADAKLLPFSERIGFAYKNYVENYIRMAERALVAKEVKSEFNLTLQVRSMEYKSVYLPCYIINYEANGEEFQGVVGGFTGEVYSIEHFEASKNAWLSGAVGTSLGLLALPSVFTFKSLAAWFIKFQFLPFMLVYKAPLIYSLFQKHYNDAVHERMIAKSSTKVVEHDYTKGNWLNPEQAMDMYAQFQLKQHRVEEYDKFHQEQEYAAAMTGIKSARRHPDPKGYYESLGLDGTESSDTISKSFKKLASLYHPDNKETGDSEIFKRISEAHSVLSKPETRRKYDLQYQ